MKSKFSELEKSIIEAINDESTDENARVNFDFNNATTGVKKSYLKRLKDPVSYVMKNYARVTKNQVVKSLNSGKFGQATGLLKLLDVSELLKVSEKKYYNDLLNVKRNNIESLKMTDEERELQKELIKLNILDWGEEIKESEKNKGKKDYISISFYSKSAITTIIY